jgi:hypothetical protein
MSYMRNSKFLGRRGMFVGSNVERDSSSFRLQVYTVVIGRLPSCNCAYIIYLLLRRLPIHLQGPDASRGNHCKHIVRHLLL